MFKDWMLILKMPLNIYYSDFKISAKYPMTYQVFSGDYVGDILNVAQGEADGLCPNAEARFEGISLV